ncbi:tRNA (adenine(58)-N(1))-methyltransferase catalytic subunit trmt61a [Irineochytrium annulatum]|nr:tRNA (adenine(58)-N(1))-methyltransferase catalytic subunit trmt61a [Irineochytrium annulatum]
MSFLSYSRVIAEGDLVIAYQAPDAMTPFNVKSGNTLNNKFGAFRHADMIGLPWGTQMQSSSKKGFIYLLHPTPELWTLVLPHRTQILYLADISLVSAMLEMKPGAVVVESGTGSGSFSHSIARAISPNGKLHTFEYHQERADKAKAEFAEHGLSELIEVECRDVCKDGFGLDGVADCVFLDLPSPWEAVPSAKAAMKAGRVGRLCSFVPCVEQVQKSTAALMKHGFFDIRLFEVLIRPHEVKSIQLRALDASTAKPKRPPKRKTPPDAGNNALETAVGEELGLGAPAADVDMNGAKEDTASPEANSGPVEIGERSDDNVYMSRPLSEVRGHTSYLLFASVVK